MPPGPDQQIGQGNFWPPAETLRMPQLADLDVPPDQIISISKLLRIVSEYMALPDDFVTVEGFAMAQPETIRDGLYIRRRDPRFRTAENLHRGVVWPSKEFKAVSRFPGALARQAMNNTRGSFKLEETAVGDQLIQKVFDKEGTELDRDEIERRVKRSAVHQLDAYEERLARYHEELAKQREALLAFWRRLNRLQGNAFFKAKNLDALRLVAERSIRTAVEVGTINLDFGSLTVDGLHRAAMYKIYGLPGHNTTRLRNFRDWTVLTGRWTLTRRDLLDDAIKDLREERALYEPTTKSDVPEPS